MKKSTLASALLFVLLVLNSAFAIEFDHYHTGEEINAYMKEVSTKLPHLMTHKVLGLSAKNREIGLIILSTGGPQKEAIYINGTHHGDEKSSTEVVLGLLDYFSKNAQNPKVASYLDRYDLYLQPLINPDGHALNTRGLANGMDPNRDYSYPERSDEKSFKQKEIKLVKALVDQVKFRGALAYHSGDVSVLWPWCYTAEQSSDEALLSSISRQVGQAMGIKTFMQSNWDYASEGEFIDYLYWKHSTVALTVELSNTKTPPIKDIPAIIESSIQGVLKFMQVLDQDSNGTLLLIR